MNNTKIVRSSQALASHSSACSLCPSLRCARILDSRNRTPRLVQPANCSSFFRAIARAAAGIDIGKRGLAVCLMIGAAEAEPKVEVREFSTFTADGGQPDGVLDEFRGRQGAQRA
jgi:hypothetical protein